MIYRILATEIGHRLGQGKAILLTGPRQTGKTTLLKQLFQKSDTVQWLNGDDPETRLLLEERNGIMWATELKWNPKKRAKLPAAFVKAYPQHEWRIITPENFSEWLLPAPDS